MPERRHFIRSIRQIFGRRERYRDLSVSIQEHIAERADELVEEGIPRAQAEQAARREFGNVALIEQRSREAWQWPVVESVLSDLKFTLRRLLKAPGFTIAVLLTLAVGIGANTAVFTVVDSILLKPLPYPDSDHIVSLSLDAPGAGGLAIRRPQPLAVHVPHFFAAQPRLPIPRHLGAANSQTLPA